MSRNPGSPVTASKLVRNRPGSGQATRTWAATHHLLEQATARSRLPDLSPARRRYPLTLILRGVSVTIADVVQSNGVIHVIDKVLLPAS